MATACSNPRSQRRIALIGAPADVGGVDFGVRFGPAALRTAGLLEELCRRGCTVRDAGDLHPEGSAYQAGAGAGDYRLGGHARNAEQVAAWMRLLSATVHSVVRGGELPVVLGGDHSLSMGTVSGIAHHWAEAGREVFLLWIDAHADCNTPFTTPSGNMHGMALAALIGEGGFEPLLSDRRPPIVKPENTCILGLRAVDPGELPALRRNKVSSVGMRQIDEFGIRLPLQRLLDRVASRAGILHVSLDIDALDPTLASGVGTPVQGGLNVAQANCVMAMLHQSGVVGSLDVTELNPRLDPDGNSARMAVGLVATMLGGEFVQSRGTAAKEARDGRDAA